MPRAFLILLSIFKKHCIPFPTALLSLCSILLKICLSIISLHWSLSKRKADRLGENERKAKSVKQKQKFSWSWTSCGWIKVLSWQQFLISKPFSKLILIWITGGGTFGICIQIGTLQTSSTSGDKSMTLITCDDYAVCSSCQNKIK